VKGGLTLQTYHATWVTRADGTGVELFGLDPSDRSLANVDGVYVIYTRHWIGNQVIRVGQGRIHERAAAHSVDQSVVQSMYPGTLKIQWAHVPAVYRDGVEAFLAQQLAPIVGERFPNVPPVVVNLPGLL
jgi:hypothetical protein